MFFSICNFFITFGVAYATTLILPSGSSWRGELANDGSFYMYYACLLTATSLPMTFLILDDLGIENDLGKFVIGTSTVATVLLFTFMSVGESMIILSPTFGNGIIPFRIGMLLLLIAVQASIQWFWNRGLAIEASKDARNEKSWYVRTSTDQSIMIVCYGLGCACISERLGYTPVLGAYLAGVFLPYDDHIRHAFQKLVKWMARWILLPMFFYVRHSFILSTMWTGAL
jgi:Kef-type K+ transport system membrane component KefB